MKFEKLKTLLFSSRWALSIGSTSSWLGSFQLSPRGVHKKITKVPQTFKIPQTAEGKSIQDSNCDQQLTSQTLAFFYTIILE